MNTNTTMIRTTTDPRLRRGAAEADATAAPDAPGTYPGDSAAAAEGRYLDYHDPGSRYTGDAYPGERYPDNADPRSALADRGPGSPSAAPREAGYPSPRAAREAAAMDAAVALIARRDGSAAPLPPQPGAQPPAGPSGAPVSGAPGLLEGDGSFCPEWYKQFSDLEPYAASLAKFRRPEALAKSYAHLERLKGYPDPADPRRMEAFRLAVGLPEKAEDYHLTRPEGAADEIWDDALAEDLAGVAYRYGVPPRAMQALSERYSALGTRMLQHSREVEQQAIEQADASLQQEWGEQYEDNMQDIGNFLSRLGDEAGVDVAGLMDNPALRANADFARLMLTAARRTHEAPLHTGSTPDGPAEARRIAADPSHPLHEAYMRSNHPQHRYANEQYDRLAFGRRL
ncbi:MAG TPA: hypothetical protein H9976_06690 [Candidatus Akkermansia intestinavium]|nr:hypothetical protein [Candidatus Akkermansia intestinavium]